LRVGHTARQCQHVSEGSKDHRNRLAAHRALKARLVVAPFLTDPYWEVGPVSCCENLNSQVLGCPEEGCRATAIWTLC
jgi:hypothetical protein